MKKKKVLFVINTMGRGGAEQTLLTMLREIDPSEYSVDLFVLLGQGELIGQVPKYVHVLNRNFSEESVLSAKGRQVLLTGILRDCLRHSSLVRNFAYLVKNAADMARGRSFKPDKLLWKLVSDASDVPDRVYDLAVAYLEGGATYFVADHVRARKKAAFIHVDYRMAGYTKRLDHGSYRKMNRIYCVSEDNRSSFLSVYPEYTKKTEVFYLSPDREKVKKEAALPGGFADDFAGIRILTVARLVRQKQLDVSIRALRLYEDRVKIPEVRWYVLGEGDERAELERLIRSLHLESDFILPGVRDNPYPYMAQADIYAHCTGFEGRSIALQEAKILGKPIIASDCSGNRELIRNGEDGILVPLTPKDIVSALERMLRDPAGAARMGQKAGQEDNGESHAGRLLNLCK